MKERFELLETLVNESHWWRYLLRCRECGQRYLFQFYEEIDWDEGNDPQESTFIPVDSDEEIARLRDLPALEWLMVTPRLQSSFPNYATKAAIGWVDSQ